MAIIAITISNKLDLRGSFSIHRSLASGRQNTNHSRNSRDGCYPKHFMVRRILAKLWKRSATVRMDFFVMCLNPMIHKRLERLHLIMIILLKMVFFTDTFRMHWDFQCIVG